MSLLFPFFVISYQRRRCFSRLLGNLGKICKSPSFAREARFAMLQGKCGGGFTVFASLYAPLSALAEAALAPLRQVPHAAYIFFPTLPFFNFQKNANKPF